ncbi:hypothetical protein P152DRAFT_451147 [Eremomyces bilateralis CBS 781.70]|uniref:lytic cellulose monooxygenase (C4-dehydrogenating) n=1 Tax=Eremomyces bilateralis CBS 781.70 TaxID=1392243 RepID=A0A6G1FXC6_9PEZI|nr:uncharacterized protein P152DRAFT_451147 [Eremomyces bilateralis CBS 781.70]KAF1810398.1 hypothetical protein P152DRAFT_451147 [Eremomyces bilateralis CBS 781.70]
MKASWIVFLPSLVSAHYTFPVLNKTPDWSHVRQTANDGSAGNFPITDLDSPMMRCFEKSGHEPASTLDVQAGRTLTFTASNGLGHPGPFLLYMAKVPSGQKASSWDPSGNVWFKIQEYGPKVTAQGYQWEINGSTRDVPVTIPKDVPSGEYLLRVEHIAIHIPETPQIYISCGQINVQGGGNGQPKPLVAFPGAYSKNDPGIAVYRQWDSVPSENVPMPGPPVWKG